MASYACLAYCQLDPHFELKMNDDRGGPWLLPPEIAPSDDLTFRAANRDSASAPPAAIISKAYPGVRERVLRLLHGSLAPHVLLVGEPGVGKSLILTEIARTGADGETPFLAARRVLSIDCRHTAPEESRDRLFVVLSHVAQHAKLIACIEGFASLWRSERGGTNKPIVLSLLSRAQCRIVGLVTPREFEDCIGYDPEILEFFSRVDVAEPDLEDARALVRHFAVGLESRYDVNVEPAALDRAVDLSANYILNDQLPAKAVKVLHRICEDIDFERSQLGMDQSRVTEDAVVRVVSATSGVPEETLRGVAERGDYEQSLGEFIVGQPHAVSQVAAELGLIKAGLSEPDKPASVMLFIGQTGTGKTEMAKALARFYSTSKVLQTFTLGNYVEPHSVAGLIGVPPGYVGHDQGGRLINDLNRDPYSVILLDEADKAHPDVLQPFLNLFDEGWIRDQRGVKAHGDRAIFILTTNVGQRMIADMANKGDSIDKISARMKEALSQIKHSKSNRPRSRFAPRHGRLPAVLQGCGR